MPSVREPRHPLEKRELLHKESPDTARIDGIVGKLLAEGRHPEAIEYLEVSRNPELIAQLAADAVKRGSAFLLQAADRLSGTKSPAEAWTQLAANALSRERYLDAVRAYTALGDEERAEAVRVEHCPDYEPFKPQGK